MKGTYDTTEFNRWAEELKVSSQYVEPRVLRLVVEDDIREVKKADFINRLDDMTERILRPKYKQIWDVLTR